MNPEKQRIAIAVACGWKLLEPYKVGHINVDWPVFEKDGRKASCVSNTLPRYTEDLNAMREAEDHCEPDLYCDTLEDVIQAWMIDSECPEYGNLKYWFIRATAAQRAEAFLKTLGLWDQADKPPTTTQ